MFLKVEGKHEVIQWMPINEEKETGMGYFTYKAGSIKYETGFNRINFIIQPIQKENKETKTSIVFSKYTFYISDSEL